VKADALSRNPQISEITATDLLHQEPTQNQLLHVAIKDNQKSDPELLSLIQSIEKGDKGSQFILMEGILCFVRNKQAKAQVVLPE
jgi:hypothetical protein